MPALSLKPEFNDKLLSGQKLFTLRNPRSDGRDPKTGCNLYFYNGLRTKHARKVATFRCEFNADVWLLYGWIAVAEWSPIVLPEQLDEFSRRDGFDDYEKFCAFHGIKDGMKKRLLKMAAWESEVSLRQIILGKDFA